MVGRKIQGIVGAFAVAALLAAAMPAEAADGRSRGKESPTWACAWEALADLWQAALERVGVWGTRAASTPRASVARGSEPPPPTPSGDEGSGIDPWGAPKR